jgi:hypothetical protein
MFRATWLFAIFSGENTTIPTSPKKYKVDCQICYLFRVLNFAFFIRKTNMLIFCMKICTNKYAQFQIFNLNSFFGIWCLSGSMCSRGTELHAELQPPLISIKNVKLHIFCGHWCFTSVSCLSTSRLSPMVREEMTQFAKVFFLFWKSLVFTWHCLVTLVTLCISQCVSPSITQLVCLSTRYQYFAPTLLRPDLIGGFPMGEHNSLRSFRDIAVGHLDALLHEM